MNYKDSEEYKQGFENAIMEVHMQYNLRSKKNQDTATKENDENLVKKISDFDSKKTTENPTNKAT